ncbi:hypothetical protein GCM10023235_12440 [Kitasatospora terrestris]|uniref:Uncharacterized protein n=1 Tax=Kitasatospora terrestris TaxID=258051 RepID=A0ABP9DD49_9ACTN
MSLVELAYSGAFSTAQLLHGGGADVLAGEPHLVHVPCDGESFLGAAHQPGLTVEEGCAAAGAESCGVHAYALLADPADSGPGVGEKVDGAVGDAGAWAEKHDGDHRRGHAHGLTLVDDDDCVFVAVDVAPLDVDAGDTVGETVQVVRVGFPPDVGHGSARSG